MTGRGGAVEALVIFPNVSPYHPQGMTIPVLGLEILMVIQLPILCWLDMSLRKRLPQSVFISIVMTQDLVMKAITFGIYQIILIKSSRPSLFDSNTKLGT